MSGKMELVYESNPERGAGVQVYSDGKLVRIESQSEGQNRGVGVVLYLGIETLEEILKQAREVGK